MRKKGAATNHLGLKGRKERKQLNPGSMKKKNPRNWCYEEKDCLDDQKENRGSRAATEIIKRNLHSGWK